MKKPNHYTSIDNLPQYNWRMIGEKNDLTFMLVDRGKMANKAELKEAFEKIKDEYIDTFGINDNHLKVLELQQNIAILQIEMAVTGERVLKNWIRIAEIELQSILKNSEKTKHSGTNTILSKYMGFHVNERTITVREYHEMVKTMSNEFKRKAA